MIIGTLHGKKHTIPLDNYVYTSNKQQIHTKLPNTTTYKGLCVCFVYL
jgi:hypothetical protein